MNISFLNPVFLWGLCLSLVPILIHLFFRRKLKRIDFSELKFIELALKKLQGSVKVRNYLLLLTRILILIMLVLCFTGPVWRYDSAGAGSAGENTLSIVLLIDASYSMNYQDGGRPRIDYFKDLAKKIVSLVPVKSRIGIVVYSNRVESASPNLTNDAVHLNKMIDDVKATNRTSNITVAFPVVNELFSRAPGSNRAVIVLSDLSKHGFKNKISPLKEKARIIVFPQEQADNLWLTDGNAFFDKPNQEWRISAGFDRQGSGMTDSWPISYYLSGEKKGTDFAKIGKLNQLNQSFTYTGSEIDLSGYVELAADKLKQDNKYYFTAKRSQPFKVWIVDGDPQFGGVRSESFYLKNVFENCDIVGESEIDKINFTLPGLIVLANVRDDNPKIDEFIKSGGGAIVFLGDHYSEKFCPEYLPANIGNEFDNKMSVLWNSETGFGGLGLQMLDFDVGKIVVEKGFVLQPKDGEQTIASLSSGWPFITESTYGNGTVVMFASSADRDWNNMPSKPVYAPLIRSIADYASKSSVTEKQSSIVVGQLFYFEKVKYPEIAGPQGKKYKPDIAGGQVLFLDTEEPGIYTLFSQGKEVVKFIVNLDTRSDESNLSAMTAAELKKYFIGSVVIAMPAYNWESKLMPVLCGKDIARPIILFILVLLLLEILLSNPSKAAMKGI